MRMHQFVERHNETHNDSTKNLTLNTACNHTPCTHILLLATKTVWLFNMISFSIENIR